MRANVALVTGAARRIGRQIALRLAEEGYGLVLHYGSSRQSAEELASEIAGAAARRSACRPIFGDPEGAARMIPAAARQLGPVNLLVNSAAVFQDDAIDALDLALWRRQLPSMSKRRYFWPPPSRESAQ